MLIFSTAELTTAATLKSTKAEALAILELSNFSHPLLRNTTVTGVAAITSAQSDPNNPNGESEAVLEGFLQALNGDDDGFNGSIDTLTFTTTSAIGLGSSAIAFAEAFAVGQFLVGAGETFSFDYDALLSVTTTSVPDSIATAEVYWELVSLNDNTVFGEFTEYLESINGNLSQEISVEQTFSQSVLEETLFELFVINTSQSEVNLQGRVQVSEPFSILPLGILGLTLLGIKKQKR
ncbi:MAG: hypothetical protein ACFCU5_06150 [Pleurocapsa sp.]